MRIHSLRARIAFVIILLMLAAQAAGFLVISSVIRSNARANAFDQLSVAERVLTQILHGRGQQLTQAATVVAGDFGFREAVATHDENTVASALANHGNRIHADVSMLVDLDGKLVADNTGPAPAGARFAFPDLIRRAGRDGSASAIGMLNGRLYQLVAVPVKAPLPIAWIAMGFAIDNATAHDMAGITLLDVSFLHRGKDGRWAPIASSRTAHATSGRDAASLTADDYATRLALLPTSDGTVAVLLQRSLYDALAPFRRLQSALLLITLVGVALSGVGSIVTARSITRPIETLIGFARRMGLGDYTQPVEMSEDQHGEIGELANAFNAMRQGISERERRITELAYEDPLTGLPNRARFSDHLHEVVQQALPASRSFSVLMMDLDRFKYVNDTLGHLLGDRLLCEVAAKLSRMLQHDADMIARLGGDEFAVLLPQHDADAAASVAACIETTLEEPVTIEGQLVDVGASIGIVTFPQHGTDMSVLLRHADIAMYVAKRGNLGHVAFEDRYDQHSAERLSLMSELRQAVERNELTLFYQPKVDLASGKVKYVEALVRWDHPTRGFVPPDQFIPFAEQTGYIKAISQWVANRALEQCAAWRDKGIDLAVSVNVSARELILSTLPDMFAGLLQKHQVDPQLLWIEITESAIMDDPNHAIDTLDRLHALGIRLAIDDFGTGYSSLTYLKRMPVHELKIDKSFVMGMIEHRDDETIVRSTIDLGHNMGLKVVAEGVETEEMMNRLRDLSCDLAQGYHLSRPLPPAKLEQWMLDWEIEQARRDADCAVE